jgi:hypothetical protein
MRRQDYLNRAQVILDEAQRRIDEEIHPCNKCKFYKHGSRTLLIDSECTHPIVQVLINNTTNGSAKRDLQRCDTQRSTHSTWGSTVCGPDGELFEMETRSIFRQFIDWMFK